MPAGEVPVPPATEPPAADQPPTYVGDAACVACHDALREHFSDDYGKTLHAKLFSERNARTEWMKRGCEACHGPGSAHVAAGGGKGVGGLLTFAADTPEQTERADAACLQCHRGGKQRYWHGSVHQTRDLSCSSCHTVMKPVSQSHLLAEETEVATCARCHAIQRSRVYRNAHMPLRPGKFNSSTASEGKMSCSSCHNGHGSVTKNLISSISVNDGCLSCHADKRGPFLWEHAPVTEDCLGCHDPHGSTRRAMLKFGLPRLCQTCHATPDHGTNPREPNNRFVAASSCLQCHTAIHGSNHPSGFAFTR